MMLITAPGCGHAKAGHYRLERQVAGAAVDATQTDVDSLTARAGREGVVDLSEPPTVVDAPPSDTPKLADHRFAPGPMQAATAPAVWGGDPIDGPSVALELQNACPLSFDYAFGPSASPGEVDEARRILDGRTIRTQLIPEGHWLHLWDQDRWLGAAVTTADGGQLEISPDCDELTVEVELPRRGPVTFAIHWELDWQPGGTGPVAPAPNPVPLAVEIQDRPEPWGVDVDASLPDERVELRLANACAEPVDYAFTAELDGEPEISATMPGNSERRVEIPLGWWLRYRVLDDGWRGGATTSHGDGVLWIESNCVDFGVADGEVVGLGGGMRGARTP